MHKEPIRVNEIQKLITKVQAGDQHAFGLLYEEYYTPVFRYAYLRVVQKSEAEDIAQQTFLKIFSKGIPIQNQGKNPLAYFFTVARNIIIDQSRKKSESHFSDFEEGFTETLGEKNMHEEKFDTGIQMEAVQKVFQYLSPDQQEVISLKFFGEQSTKEIAELLKKNEATIRQIQSRALKILSEKLRHHE